MTLKLSLWVDFPELKGSSDPAKKPGWRWEGLWSVWPYAQVQVQRELVIVSGSSP